MPPAPAATGAKPQPKGLNLKSPWLWVGVLAIAVIGGGYMLYRQKQAAAASTGSDVTSADTTGYDQDAGQLGTLQSEIGDLQSSDAQQGTAPAATPTVKVPNLVGNTTAGAVSTLFAVNLTPAGTRGVPGTNIVTATAPPAGTAVKPKSTVTISSKAPAKKAAPKKKAPAGKAA
jgi:hypothetical protein